MDELHCVARLDRLGLLPVAEHLDGHAGLGLQLEELEDLARPDLAYFVHHQHRVPTVSKFASLDCAQQNFDGVGSLDPGFPERIGLTPRQGCTDDLPPL